MNTALSFFIFPGFSFSTHLNIITVNLYKEGSEIWHQFQNMHFKNFIGLVEKLIF